MWDGNYSLFALMTHASGSIRDVMQMINPGTHMCMPRSLGLCAGTCCRDWISVFTIRNRGEIALQGSSELYLEIN
jgi:hypothetical protein